MTATGGRTRTNDDTDPRHKKIWIPRRCEVQACHNREGLKLCQQCHMVMYCCRKCQKDDWKRHKVECAHLASLNLQGHAYTIPERDRTEFQDLKAKVIDDLNPKPEGVGENHCEICGRSSLECDIISLECCGIRVCNREADYRFMSYTRNFCERSHRRYTQCGKHHSEDHHDICPHCDDKHYCDFRDCQKCIQLMNMDESSHELWCATNGYNNRPPRPHRKGMFFTTECSECKGRVHTGFEAFSSTACCGEVMCKKCAGGEHWVAGQVHTSFICKTHGYDPSGMIGMRL